MFSLHSCKIKTLISSSNQSTQKPFFTNVNVWTLLKLLSYSFTFIGIYTFLKRHLFISSCTITLVSLHLVMKSLKTDFEHSNVSSHETTFHTFLWLHSFIFCVFQVKYSASKLFLLLVLSAVLYILILKLHTNKPQ